MTEAEAQKIIENWQDFKKSKEKLALTFKDHGLSTPKYERYSAYCTAMHMFFDDVIVKYKNGKITDADTLVQSFVNADSRARGRHLLESD